MHDYCDTSLILVEYLILLLLFLYQLFVDDPNKHQKSKNLTEDICNENDNSLQKKYSPVHSMVV